MPTYPLLDPPAWKDMATTKRWIKVDGDWKKNKVTYESVPIRFVPTFDVTTPASNPFDQDAEITMLTDHGKWGFDVKKDQGDIMQVYTIMNKKCVMDRLGGAATYTPHYL